MSDVAAIIADMVRAGVDPDLIGRTAAALAQNVQAVQIVQDPVADRRRAYDRQRKANNKSTGIPPETAESADKVSPKKETSPTPPKEKTTPSNFPPVVARGDFDQFWSLFPNKVGKRDAQKAFASALQRADIQDILAGLRRYVGKLDDRPWCNPSTFLNQDRWTDQPATSMPRQQATAPPHPGQGFNKVLDELQGKSHVPHSGPTIDASVNRTDSGSPANLVQFDAFSARRGP